MDSETPLTQSEASHVNIHILRDRHMLSESEELTRIDYNIFNKVIVFIY